MEYEIMHYGVNGMRWGKRKQFAYSPESGTYHRMSKKEISQNKKNITEKKNSEAKSMSDEDLRQRISRIQMERRYSELTAPQKTNGSNKIQKVVKGLGTAAVATTSVLTLAKNSKAIKEMLDKTAKTASKMT